MPPVRRHSLLAEIPKTRLLRQSLLPRATERGGWRYPEERLVFAEQYRKPYRGGISTTVTASGVKIACPCCAGCIGAAACIALTPCGATPDTSRARGAPKPPLAACSGARRSAQAGQRCTVPC